MPAPETANRHDDAIYWPKIGVNHHNETLRGAPVALKVRWSTKRTQGFDALGNPIALDGSVMTDRVLIIGSILWKGTLTVWNTSGSLGQDDELMEVVNQTVIDDIKGRETQYWVGLVKYSDRLPSTS